MPGAYEKRMSGPRFERMVERVQQCREMMKTPSQHHQLITVQLPLLTIEVGNDKRSVEEFCYAEGLDVLCDVLRMRRTTPSLGDVGGVIQELSGMLCKEMNPFDDDLGYLPLLVYFLSERHKYYVDINWMPGELRFMKMWIESHLAVLCTPWDESDQQQLQQQQQQLSKLPQGEQIVCEEGSSQPRIAEDAPQLQQQADMKASSPTTCCPSDTPLPTTAPCSSTPARLTTTSTSPSTPPHSKCTSATPPACLPSSFPPAPLTLLPLSTRLAAVNTLYVSLVTFPPHRVVSQMAECFHTEGCCELIEALRGLQFAMTATAKGRRRMAQVVASVAFFGLGLQVRCVWEVWGLWGV
eukprot:GHVQ01016593.1.p1 GENE.GHVQ01016593.1~~GHVQ01016593.1.p1  ORF type:complete len:353 (+),score=71.23 GHVQ01016593.1:642-1700(+)